jgi:hypothetical protein
MGYINQSLYTGEIEYTPIPKGLESYWLIPLTCEPLVFDRVALSVGLRSDVRSS